MLKEKIIIAGVDEVGRGPLAGPVVTAAVILSEPIAGVKDSKKLSPIQRQKLAEVIKNKALCYAYGRAEVEEINTLNIHYATLLAMKRAIECLEIKPNIVYVDGIFTPELCTSISCHAVVKGDETIPEISAASILAKVARDKEMESLDNLYPGYNFAAHKGYGTYVHRRLLKELGPSPIHRSNYAIVIESAQQKLGLEI